jgi:RimJ/RimL family protein N-acetyltransferase
LPGTLTFGLIALLTHYWALAELLDDEVWLDLVEHLFDTTTVHRLCANTEADNAAEQRVLEKCGFRREGVLRQAGFRGGRWRDVVVYGRLRDDVVAPDG